MRSHLLEGKVRHRRARPFTYELEHDVFYFAIDLAELDDVVARLRLVSRDRRERRRPSATAITCCRPATDLPTDILAPASLGRASIPTGWRVTLVTSLRVLGYVFNPASFYLCRDDRGTLRVVVVEVHNTYGERHQYTLRRVGDGRPVRGLDGQGVLRVAVHRDGRRGTPSMSATTPPACGSRSPSDRAAEPMLSTSLVLRRDPVDRPGAAAAAAATPARRPQQDDRAHPLACPAAVAARRAHSMRHGRRTR